MAAGTSRSAKAIGMEKEIGSLAIGLAGDAAVFTWEEGRFNYRDAAGNQVEGQGRLTPALTVMGGEVVWRGH